MTAADMGRWGRALQRMLDGYDWKMPHPQADAWFDQLERYPIDAVEQALRDAPSESGRFKPTVGLVEQLAKKEMSGTPKSTGDWHAPHMERNAAGQVVVYWRCHFCEDTGWRAKETATGRLLTNEELLLRQEPLRVPREDGEPTYTMSRCACKTGGVMAVAS